MREAIAETDLVEAFKRERATGCGSQAAIEQWHFDIFNDREFADQIERLEDESDLLTAHF